MSIIIGGDIVPTKSNLDLFENADAASLVGEELLQLLEEASFRIFNLEVPLTDVSSPIRKHGPHLIASTASAGALQALKTDLVTLANNHILDQGSEGLRTTCRTLSKYGIAYVGAGECPADAAAPATFPFYGKTVGVYACAEHEFSIVSDHSPGANPFDPLWSLDHVAELKEATDYVIVLYHGGKEHYRYPSPQLQKTCRRLIDKGADLVVCQHSHCIGCEEQYKGGTIVYGQGNFLFDYRENEFWQTGILISLDKEFGISYIPCEKHHHSVRKAGFEEGQRILEAFRNRSEEIQEAGAVEKKYCAFTMEMTDMYLRGLSGRPSLITRILNKISAGRYMKHRLAAAYDEQTRLRIENYLTCEAHSELLLNGLKSGIRLH